MPTEPAPEREFEHRVDDLRLRPPAHSSSRSTSCTANNPPNFSFFFSSTFNRHRARARARTLHRLHAETMAILCDRTKSISERFCPVAFNCMIRAARGARVMRATQELVFTGAWEHVEEA